MFVIRKELSVQSFR